MSTTTTIIAIDPGQFESAYVIYETENRFFSFFQGSNKEVNTRLWLAEGEFKTVKHLVIEIPKCYGFVVGDSILETCVWAGRFIESWTRNPEHTHETMPRKTAVTRICLKATANDRMVRSALIDRFGGEKAIGCKSNQGPLYGVKNDIWAALAVAVAWRDMDEINNIRAGKK